MRTVYLGDFIHYNSVIVKSLHDLIPNYDKTRKMVWTPEIVEAFNEMILKISKRPTMHFLSDTITLHPDASDYNPVRYLFQAVDGVEQPVAFVS